MGDENSGKEKQLFTKSHPFVAAAYWFSCGVRVAGPRIDASGGAGTVWGVRRTSGAGSWDSLAGVPPKGGEASLAFVSWRKGREKVQVSFYFISIFLLWSYVPIRRQSSGECELSFVAAIRRYVFRDGLFARNLRKRWPGQVRPFMIDATFRDHVSNRCSSIRHLCSSSYRLSMCYLSCPLYIHRVALEGMIKEQRPFGEILQRALQTLPEDQVGLLGISVRFRTYHAHQAEHSS